jgi:CRP-like cAMP-binding protein
VAQGAPAPGLIVVRGGHLFESSVSPDGRSALHDVLAPGDVAGAMPPGSAPVSVRSAGRTYVRLLDPLEIESLLARRPAVGASLLRALLRRGDAARRIAAELAWYPVTERILLRLVDLARRLGRRVPDGLVIDVTLTQEQLGALTGCARENVNRALVRLAARHLIRLDGRRMVVLDAALDHVNRHDAWARA